MSSPRHFQIQDSKRSWAQLWTPVISEAWEAEIEGSQVQSQNLQFSEALSNLGDPVSK